MYNRFEKGSSLVDLILGAAIIVLVVLPVFSFVIEKYIITNKADMINDTIDLTNIAVYNALDTGAASKKTIDFNETEVLRIYRSLLAKNLLLNEDLTPKVNSIADGTVILDSIIIYIGNYPLNCPDGTLITRPTIHSRITVPIKPSLYRHLLLNILGRDYIELKIHVDSDIPIND